jgi:hemerythrin-like domain-containing protein
MPDAIAETQLVHDAHRRATTVLVDAGRRDDVPLEAVVALRDFLVPTLHHHHRSEDEALWPLIVGAAPELRAAFRGLSAQHATLDTALERLAAAEDRHDLVVLAGEVHGLLHRHLDDEEPILFPALRTHVSADEWNAFSQHVIATAPVEGTHLLLGLFDLVGDAEAVDGVLSAMPPPAQAMVPALRAQGAAALQLLGAT